MVRYAITGDREENKMKWFKNMSVTSKLMAGFLSVIALAIFLGIFSIVQLSRVDDAATDMKENWVPSISAIGKLNSSFVVFRLTEYRHINSTNASVMTKVESDLKKWLDVFEANLKEYKNTITTSQEQKVYDQFITQWNNYIEIHHQIVALTRNNEKNKAKAMIRGKSLDAYYRIQDSINQITDVNLQGVAQASELGDQLYTSSRTMIIFVILAGATIGIGIAILIGRMISRPLSLVVKRAQQITDGDLTGEHIVVNSNDEIGILTISINQMSDALKNLILEVTTATQEVASASTEIAASSEQMATGMSQQTEQVTQISSAVEQMGASVLEVARKSSEAAKNAMAAGTVAEEGGTVVSSTIDGMQTIREAVNSSSDSVTSLGKRGEQIGQIIEVIKDIAEQTNLLALNAAIEAARAGEHGRGFAVVADEVRKLADRTTVATEEIAESITAIQIETTQAVGRMNTGTQQVKTGVERATAAGNSLKQIVTHTQDVADMIHSIASATEEQSAASEQIACSVETISAVTKQSAEGAGQAATAATQLSTKAEHLKRLVTKFKVNA